MWRKFLAGALWAYAALTTFVIGPLGYIDLIVQRIANPGWLSDVLTFFLAPPAWLILPLIVFGFVVLFWPVFSASQIAYLKRLKWWGICWEEERFRLNAAEKNNEVFVHNFGMAGRNKSRCFVEIEEFYLISHNSGQTAKVKIHPSNNGSYAPIEAINPVPPGAEMECIALFVDEQQPRPEGMTRETFLYFWMSFTVVLAYRYKALGSTRARRRRRVYRRHFGRRFVLSQLNLPEQMPKEYPPRISRK
jgi:hypothetical protein